MKDATLGDALRKLDGLRDDFDRKLRGKNGEKWLDGFAKFLRGEDPRAKEADVEKKFRFECSMQVAGENPFEARTHFMVDVSPTAPVKIGYLGDNFKKHFLPLTEEDVAPVTLVRHVFFEGHPPLIFWELAESHDVKISHLWEALRAQRNGEDGGVLDVSRPNFLFIFAADHTLWIVDVRRGYMKKGTYVLDGWSIDAKPFGRTALSFHNEYYRVISCVK